MWVYSQQRGNLFQEQNGTFKLLTKGYSDSGIGENNPEMEFVRDIGPLPVGQYTIGAPEVFNHMSNCLRLTPDPTNIMGGRSGFWMHDGIFHGPHGDSSHGCICVRTAARSVIWDSGDHLLQVVKEDPTQ
jgi:hypothetical protein